MPHFRFCLNASAPRNARNPFAERILLLTPFNWKILQPYLSVTS